MYVCYQGNGFCPPNTLTLFYIEVKMPLFSTSLLSYNTERCHEEIVRVLGYDRLPSMDDRDKLPYTFATVHEIQRCANILPLGVIQETIRPTKLRGYDIPQVMNGAWMNDWSYISHWIMMNRLIQTVWIIRSQTTWDFEAFHKPTLFRHSTSH